MRLSKYYVPIAKRCPHGHDVSKCETCQSARKSADDWAQRQRDKKKTIL